MSGTKKLSREELFEQEMCFMEGVGGRPLFDLLEEGGVTLPAPETLDDGALYAKLWEVIRAMALLGHYLSSTDHLSDRELYERLWSEILREPACIPPVGSRAACQIDILGGGSDEDFKIRMKYYADEFERESWASDDPDDEIPPHEDLPYDRDRLLPQPDYGGPMPGEIC
ncbi:MAG: hypothetical protein GXX81_04470 [Acidobacteria bacterium]|jgi:hypothetical protein|nr:hypothetical protein [Acidobacteriota bacterium]